jgi:hypothetical protein
MRYLLVAAPIVVMVLFGSDLWNLTQYWSGGSEAPKSVWVNSR